MEIDIFMKSKDVVDFVLWEYMMLEVVEYGGEGIEIDRNLCLDWIKVGGVVGGSGSGSL